DPGADHLQEAVLGQVGVAGVVWGGGVGTGEPDALVELADGEQSGVAGQLALGRLDDERRAKKIEDLWPRGWETHRQSPWEGIDLDAQPVGRERQRYPSPNGQRVAVAAFCTALAPSRARR